MPILPDESSQEEALEQLPEDNETPFRPADDIPSRIDDTHPVTDTDLDPQEVYDEGYGAAADVDEQAGREE